MTDDLIARLEARIEELEEVLEQCARIVRQLIPAGTINRSRCVDEILRITPSTPSTEINNEEGK